MRLFHCLIAKRRRGDSGGGGDTLAINDPSKISLGAGVTFTRALAAYVSAYAAAANESNGRTLVQAISGEPRFAGARRNAANDWKDTFADTSSIPDSYLDGVLLEGARTNIVLQSNTFSNASWSKAATVTQNVTGPDGVANSAWTITDNSAAASQYLFQSKTGLTVGVPYVCSFFIKKTAGVQPSYPVIDFTRSDTGVYTSAVTIDTSNGILTPWTAYTGFTVLPPSAVRISSFNSDYWFVEIVRSPNHTTNQLAFISAATSNPAQSTGIWDVAAQGSSVIYNLQIEQASFASSPILTTTAAVARPKDLLSYNVSGNLTTTNSSVGFDFTPSTSVAFTGYLFGSYVDASNSTSILFDGTTLTARKRIAGVNYDATIAFSPVKDVTYAILMRWDSSLGVDIFLDAVKGTTNSNTTAAQLGVTFQIGSDGNSLNQCFGAIRNLQTWV